MSLAFSETPKTGFLATRPILQFYRGCPMVISKKTIIFKGFRGGPTFSRGEGNFFHGGGGGGGSNG